MIEVNNNDGTNSYIQFIDLNSKETLIFDLTEKDGSILNTENGMILPCSVQLSKINLCKNSFKLNVETEDHRYHLPCHTTRATMKILFPNSYM